ncbi:ABC transporter substrate-binding protein [Ideonella sp. YS5]|uniref:ABC transporter substrate-binding protein n=1 Tax=Ideonella sp. YS5 TaxID=3453714 RepID=UPI003EEF06A6
MATLRRMVWVLMLAAPAAFGAPPPIVIGQSLPLTGPAFPIANRVQAGAKALVDRLNAAGGINGRRLELRTLDDGGDARRLAINLGTLVREHSAVAIVNCLGERACAQAAATTRELGTLLIGPLSGAVALRAPAMRHVFTFRPDDRHEADALVQQLRATGISHAVLLIDGDEPARELALGEALKAAGITSIRLQTRPERQSALAALHEIAKAAPQALVLNLGPESLDLLARVGTAWQNDVPATVAAMSSPGLTQLTRLLRDRVIGFSSVVPTPELSQLPLAREFERDADTYVGPEAFSFEGLAAYLHLRVLAEALRRAGSRTDAAHLAETIESLGSFDLGGWPLRFGAGRHQGSDRVEIGLRGRDGKLRR